MSSLVKSENSNLIRGQDLNLQSFGIEVYDNKYKVFVQGVDLSIYEGSLESLIELNNFYDVTIRVNNCYTVKDYIILEIVAQVFGAFDIEYPLQISHLVKVPLSNLETGAELLAYTSRPLFITSMEVFKSLVNCYGYKYPLDSALIVNSSNLFVSDTEIIYFNIPIKITEKQIDLCKKVKFLR